MSLASETENNSGANDKSRIAGVAFGLSMIAVMAKIFGFIEKVLVARFFGTGYQSDAYFASTGIVLSIIFLVKELIYPSVLPVFAQALKGGIWCSACLFRKTLFTLATIMVLISAVMFLFSDGVSSVMVPGFSDARHGLTSSMLKLLSPACFFLSLSTFSYAVLNCRQNFFRAALPEAFLKIAVAAGLLVLAPRIGIYSVALVMSAGSVVVFMMQLLFIPETGKMLSPGKGSDGNFKQVGVLMLPLLAGVLFSHLNGMIDNMLASTLPGGHLSYLGYSKKMIDAVLLIGPVALMTVVYSQLSHLAQEESLDMFRELFVNSFRLILYISLPLAIFLLSQRKTIIWFLFESGKFTAESTAGTSAALLIYSSGFLFLAMESLMVFTFYALSNTRVPVKVGILGVVIDVTLAVILLKPLGYRAIALAFVISRSLKVFILGFLLDRKFFFIFNKIQLVFICKLIFCGIAAFGSLSAISLIKSGESFFFKFLVELVLPALIFISVYVLLSYVLHVEELDDLKNILVRKFRRVRCRN